METFNQEEFNNFIVENNVYGFFDEAITLVSGRKSHFYANWRNVVEDVFLTDKLSDFVINFLKSKGISVDTFYGVPEGATKIGVITQFKNAMKNPMFEKGSSVLAMGRKLPKEHGAAKDRFFVGMPKGRVAVIEDVTTTGGSLIKELRNLKEAGINVVAVISLTNRMEKAGNTLSVKENIEREGFKFFSMSSSLDILPIVAKKLKPSLRVIDEIKREFSEYGVREIEFGMENIIDKLMNEIDKKENPCIIGLDPQLRFIPSHIKKDCLEKYGDTFQAVGETLIRFCKEIIDATYDLVPAYKPNMCFYEKYGSEGVRAFKEIVSYIKEKGCIAIEDAKRNEVGESTKAYAEGHLGEVDMCSDSKSKSLDVDIMVVNPYLGSNGLNPFIDVCEKYNKGIFILAKTSNPSSGEFQDKLVEIDEKEKKQFEELGFKLDNKVELYNLVALHVNNYAQKHIGNRGYSFVGAVVGATYPSQAVYLRKIMSNSFFLVPGYGAQGGSAKDIVNCFNDDGYGAVINSSRGIIFAYRKTNDEENFALRAREATKEMIKNIRAALMDAGKFPKNWKGGFR